MKCLYCRKESTSLFCQGGGATITKPNTGEKENITKSYCYNDFLTIFRLTENLGVKHSPEETEYLLYKEDIKVWYSRLPLVFEDQRQKILVPVMA